VFVFVCGGWLWCVGGVCGVGVYFVKNGECGGVGGGGCWHGQKVEFYAKGCGQVCGGGGGGGGGGGVVEGEERKNILLWCGKLFVDVIVFCFVGGFWGGGGGGGGGGGTVIHSTWEACHIIFSISSRLIFT